MEIDKAAFDFSPLAFQLFTSETHQQFRIVNNSEDCYRISFKNTQDEYVHVVPPGGSSGFNITREPNHDELQISYKKIMPSK